MIRPYDFHAHTVYCDGVNTAEEMIRAAIEKGLEAIGFSGHMYTPFDTSWCMSTEEQIKYFEEIRELGYKYRDKISVFCGIERDYYSEGDTACFDYIIGSVHYVYKDGSYIPVDESPKILKDAVDMYYGGDWLEFCRDYYRLEADVYNKTHCNIIGHFDLVTKFNKRECFFDEKNREYRDIAKTALARLAAENVIFEINTGAVSRKYKNKPYPAAFLLDELQKLGGSVILSGDSHSGETLAYDFKKSLKLAKKHNFPSIKTFTSAGFIDKAI